MSVSCPASFTLAFERFVLPSESWSLSAIRSLRSGLSQYRPIAQNAPCKPLPCRNLKKGPRVGMQAHAISTFSFTLNDFRNHCTTSQTRKCLRRPDEKRYSCVCKYVSREGWPEDLKIVLQASITLTITKFR